MSKKKILIITQEMEPYTALSTISEIANKLPLFLNDNSCEIRILMPRFGTVNERRHRLHEVVRLSGMNLIVNDDDFPLIIKVASLPTSRIQVYFLDNDDFFKRKSVFEDDAGVPFDDNIDRMVFFCKGTVETLKKFSWAPDIIHCHGWMTGLIPSYIRTAYKTDPLFHASKIIYSLYDTIPQPFALEEFYHKASINNLTADDMVAFQDGDEANIHKGAAIFSDGIIRSSDLANESVLKMLESIDKPIMEYDATKGVDKDYIAFYQRVESMDAVVSE
jgi:starch synthase